MSSTKILQPSCSPKKLTLLPTTGPRSRRAGASRDVSVDSSLRSALVANRGSSTVVVGTGRSGTSLRRVAIRSKSPTGRWGIENKKSGIKNARAHTHATGHALAHILNSQFTLPDSAALSSHGLRLCRRRSGCAGRGGAGRAGAGRGGSRLGRGLCTALALHVHAAAEMRALGDRHARRHDVAIDRSVVADRDLISRRHIAGHLAEHDDRLRKYLRFDAPVRSDRQHMIAQLNGAFDLSFDGEIFAAVQLAFDDDRFPDVHVVPLNLLARLHAGT